MCAIIGTEIDYKIKFIEIKIDLDHIHFLIQRIPSMPVYNSNNKNYKKHYHKRSI